MHSNNIIVENGESEVFKNYANFDSGLPVFAKCKRKHSKMSFWLWPSARHLKEVTVNVFK